MVTVAVRPGMSWVPRGIRSTWTRTGMRWARRTQEKVGWTAGTAVFAVTDTDSFYVAGYFQETKLEAIEIGDRVRVQVMGESRLIDGHVQSIASGIANRELSQSPSMLANVTPTFSWVRLAQRVPVRIAIDHVPDGVRLIAGRTASVMVEPQGRQ